MAELDTRQAQQSNGLKRKRNNETSLVPAACAGDEDTNDYEDDNDYNDSSVNTQWIDHWVHKPYGERGCRNRDSRPGWGKPEALVAAGITEGQYL